MIIRGTRLVYGALIAVWLLLIGWQVVEHSRVRQAAKGALINRAKDVSSTLGLVMRSQRRWGVISKERIESALSSLVKPGEVNAVALLNAAGEVVAAAGATIDFETRDLVPTGEHWTARTVTLMNLVDLETNLTSEAEGPRPTIVLPHPDRLGPPGTNRFGTNRPPPPPPPPPGTNEPAPPRFALGDTNATPADTSASPPPPPGPGEDSDRPPRRRRPRGEGDGRPPFGRPFWMSEEEYKAAIQKQGVHSVAMVLSTQPMLAVMRADLLLRVIISVLASVSVVGLGLAWRNLSRSSDLEMRLMRASELNTRLREMNLAAAGLAHETKNPLNIIRGIAQMISKQPTAPEEIRQRARGIIDEADRVTAQLNEFINFSRPREVRRSAVALGSVVGEVVRALGHDLEEKSIRLQVQNDLPTIEADEQQLRQALFNLLLNAIQAADANGEIEVAAAKRGSHTAMLEIRDNGPGVPPENRMDVFKPYFTTNEKGTGLGLAVVQQIVLAHGWEIDCLPNEPRGALFRISHLRIAAGG